MKASSIPILILISGSLLMQTIAQQQQNPNFIDCSHNNHCPVNIGLICDQGTCKCGNGSLSDSYDYIMEWDSARCAGALNSACIGLGNLPLPAGQKRIPCKTGLTCVQIQTLPKGQGTCKVVPSVNTYGSDCHETRYCDSSLGLICGSNGKCVCGNGVVNDKLNFTMEWDGERCVALPGSGCVGTRITPVGSGMKPIVCGNGECVQLSNLPPGVGVCTGNGVDPTTTINPSSSTGSTDGDGGGASSSSTVSPGPSTTAGSSRSQVVTGLLTIVISLTFAITIAAGK